mgnify:CR=1 FL=1
MINQTELNKLKTHIEKNKAFVDNIATEKGDNDKKNTISLSMSILNDYYSLNQQDAYNTITDGSDDNKIDAFYYSDDEDELTELIIIQSKYKNVYGSTGTFTEDEIKLSIDSCKRILDGKMFQKTNNKLKDKLNAYRKLLDENSNPAIIIKLYFATNGIISKSHKELDEIAECEELGIYPIFIDATKFSESPKLQDGVININIKNSDDKTDSIFTTSDGFKGRLVSCSINDLMKFYSETGKNLLLNNNVRYKLSKSSINKDIKNTFIDEPDKFSFFNNGITIICKKFKVSSTASSINKLKLTQPSIVNGGQTISTLYDLFEDSYDKYKGQFDSAKILLRIYSVDEEDIIKIAKATNSQNPINVVDLHSNDIAQDNVNKYFEKFGVGMIYKVGMDITYYDDIITNENLLQVYASLYKNEPAKAKVSKRTIFNTFYSEVFIDTISDAKCKQLFRCYHISKYLTSLSYHDEVTIKNAFYSIIYTMKMLENNILNENIPNDDMTKTHYPNAFDKSMVIINKIIADKQTVLKTKFSLNNLFKNKEIKDLIDIELGI